VLQKMLPPNNRPIPVIAREEGISEATLYNWRKAARAEGRLLPDGDSTPAGWTSADKFAVVLETGSHERTGAVRVLPKKGPVSLPDPAMA